MFPIRILRQTRTLPQTPAVHVVGVLPPAERDCANVASELEARLCLSVPSTETRNRVGSFPEAAAAAARTSKLTIAMSNSRIINRQLCLDFFPIENEQPLENLTICDTWGESDKLRVRGNSLRLRSFGDWWIRYSTGSKVPIPMSVHETSSFKLQARGLKERYDGTNSSCNTIPSDR
jgi:hypothetical protein